MAFCLSATRGDFLRTAFSREHAVCPLSGIEKRPLVGGYLIYTSAIVFSIGATAGVLYIERLSAGGRVRYGRFHCIPMTFSYLAIRNQI